MNALMILLGLVLLVIGGEALVRGASRIALLAKITPAVVGLTIVAAGTSMPELVVSIQAAREGSPGLAVGNVVGSNIFNIGAIVGIAALVRPLKILGNTVRLEWPIMIVAALVLHVMVRDGMLDRLEGAYLLAGLIAFIGFAVHIGRNSVTAQEESEFAGVVEPAATNKSSVLRHLTEIGVGVAMLAFGAAALVDGAVGVASSLGVSDAIIGLTIVAAGTSAPELVTSLVAVYRGQDDIAVGNVVGSNIFNVLAIAGATAMIIPLPVPLEILQRDIWWMLGVSLLLFPLMKTGMRITRGEGALLFAGFLAYMGVIVHAAQG